jgi:hypothetical protein
MVAWQERQAQNAERKLIMTIDYRSETPSFRVSCVATDLKWSKLQSVRHLGRHGIFFLFFTLWDPDGSLRILVLPVSRHNRDLHYRRFDCCRLTVYVMEVLVRVLLQGLPVVWP